MSNTLTALQPILFSAAQTVSAEPFGAVDALNANFNDQGVAVGDKVKVPVAPTRAATDFTPSNVTSTGTDATASDVEVEITKSRKVAWHLTSEQQRSLDNGAASAEWIRQLISQGMRTLRNECETDAVNAIYQGAGRAVGTAGTNPFASAINPLVDLRKVLRDNGAPLADLQFVMDTTSEANLLKLGLVNKANEAGSDAERRAGIVGRQYGFEMRQSAGIELHTKGTGTAYDAAGGEPALETVIALDGGTVGGTGIVAGDVVTFAGDTTKYVVNAGLAAASGSITIGRPGLATTLADAVEMTIGDNYTPNVGFDRNAVVGIMRPPLMPANPTISPMLISDQFGMTYLMLDIAQYGQRTWELHLAWGFKAVQPEHIAILMG
ncbi:P22 phage major capsid protein family protein [Roseibacterium sp. SDUM158017]|uniref:P22 phage major capsid protein family protein n=1 Tax=Roseicyclus salinarum TaxID=3036773 RepID=UPI002414E687|nr:P22 phage major capsid protein family protein [Roseibacterium sp. SDUM158017]MDG4650107.1 P22 phage major capsid protein family protein [Roseibacterium sp. SDUM158017]